MDEIPIVVIRMDKRSYGVPIFSVSEVVRLVAITPLPESSDIVEGVINLRGQTIPVVNLAQRLGLRSPAYHPDTSLVILTHGEGFMAVPVESVNEVRDVPSESIVLPQNAGQHSELLTGVAEMGEEHLIVLDPVALFTEDTMFYFDPGDSGASEEAVPGAGKELIP